MKKTLKEFAFGLFVFIWIIWICYTAYEIRGVLGFSAVQQKLDYNSYGLCGGNVCFNTYVWYRGEIVGVWYDKPDITYMEKINRRRQGEALIKKLDSQLKESH